MAQTKQLTTRLPVPILASCVFLPLLMSFAHAPVEEGGGVPEPMTMLVFGIGMAFIATQRRNRAEETVVADPLTSPSAGDAEVSRSNRPRI